MIEAFSKALDTLIAEHFPQPNLLSDEDRALIAGCLEDKAEALEAIDDDTDAAEAEVAA